MPKLIDLSGQRFGRLTVIERADSSKGKTKWLCKCECGKETVVFASNLTRGIAKSCGCLRNEVTSKRRTIHGQRRSRLYNIWEQMKGRCTRSTHPFYRLYGGRGITICEEWKDSFKPFHDWATANGYADNLTIDRIDTNGNYCPENCRWADMVTQANNTSRNHLLEYNGEVHTLAEWSKLTGINYMSLKTRIRRGWSVERALTERANKKDG